MGFRFVEILDRRSFTFGGRVGLHVSRAASGSTAGRRWTFPSELKILKKNENLKQLKTVLFFH